MLRVSRVTALCRAKLNSTPYLFQMNLLERSIGLLAGTPEFYLKICRFKKESLEMQTTEHEMRLSGDIIPFQPRTVKSEKGQSKKVVTTTIATLIAVTILHDDAESPEDKLIDMIEASGEAEVMDSSDALDMLGELDSDHAQQTYTKTPTNDNG